MSIQYNGSQFPTSQAKNLAQFQASASLTKPLAQQKIGARYPQRQKNIFIDYFAEKTSDAQSKGSGEIPSSEQSSHLLSKNDTDTNRKTSELVVNSSCSQDVSQKSFTKKFQEDEKKLLKRKRYLQLFSSKTCRRTRINHLLSDAKPIQKTDQLFCLKARNLRKLCQLEVIPEEEAGSLKPASKSMSLQTNELNRHRFKRINKFLGKRCQQSRLTEAKDEAPPPQITILEPDSNPIANMIKQKLCVQKESEQVFSFLDVTSLWQDPQTSQRLKGVQILKERNIKMCEKMRQENIQSQSADSFVDWSDSYQSENDEECSQNYKRQKKGATVTTTDCILNQSFLFNKLFLNQQEFDKFQRTSVPRASCELQEPEEILADIVSTSYRPSSRPSSMLISELEH